jgi:D-alanyl-D-alanine carboxypeptidase/D-alanyl-D-alanine-endopeptidase (penicillin-binding protein 4)
MLMTGMKHNGGGRLAAVRLMRYGGALILAAALMLLPLAARETAPARSMEDGLDRLLAVRRPASIKVSLHAVSLDDGRVLYSRSADDPMVPASNMKLVTAAAALWSLKPDYVYETPFYTTAPIRGGVLQGDLYVRGTGAPDLVCENLWVMARQLRNLGLHEVRGRLVGDDGFFDPPARVESWKSSYAHRAFAAPLGALSSNFNSVNVLVRPAERAGAPPVVVVDPFSRFFTVLNKATTRKGKMTLTVDRRYRDGRNEVVVGGAIPPGHPVSVSLRSVEDPTGYFLASFVEVAEEVGITFGRAPARGAVPEGAEEIYSFQSRSLSRLLMEMNKYSNNFSAEMVLKTMGAEMLGPPGTTAKGLQAVDAYLRYIGIPMEGVVLDDASGLSRYNRVTARLLSEVVRHVWDDFETGPEYFASLPLAGADGTLSKRMTSGAALRRVRAKSGFINSTSCLSGVAGNPVTGPVAFSILMNGTGLVNGDAKRLQDRICAVLAGSTPAGEASGSGR